MNSITQSIALCKAYIECQTKITKAIRPPTTPLFVTVARQAGTTAMRLARLLAEYLQAHDSDKSCPWAVFNRDLITLMLKEHHLPSRLAEFVPEDRVPEIQSMIRELLGAQPSMMTLIQELAETFLKLASSGNVILVGRASNIITANLPGGFHVRLVGCEENRIGRLQESEGMTPAEALRFMRNEDRARLRFAQTYFDASPEDPLLYHLVINVDRIPHEEAAAMIGEAVLLRRKKFAGGPPTA